MSRRLYPILWNGTEGRAIHPRARIDGGRYCSVAPEVLIGDSAHLWAYSPAPDGGPAIVLRRRADIRSYALLHCYGGRISVGVYSCINHFCFISGAGSVTIGDDVMLGTHTVILSSEHGLDRESATPMTQQPVALRPVVIENNVYIGAHVTILGGVTIGTGAVVAAGAVVNRDVAPRTTVGGVPAQPLRFTSKNARRMRVHVQR